MYKVFVNDAPIIITTSSQKENNYPVYGFRNIVFEELLYRIKNKELTGVNLYSTDLQSDWTSFLSNFDVVPAAGGLVINPKNEILFIFRNGIWDLPKGRIEQGETIETAAIREVEEECGIFNLTLVKPLVTTYHTYYQGRIKLKQTYWFLMTSDYEKELIPQIEEGITQVQFKKETEIDKTLQNSYTNIKLVYDSYQLG